MRGKRILRSQLNDIGIQDAYVGASVKDVPCAFSVRKRVVSYMSSLPEFYKRGKGILFFGDSHSGKSALANLVAVSAAAHGYEVYVISLSFLSAVRFGSGFEGGKDTAHKYFSRTYMDYLKAQFLVIDDMCDPLMQEHANYYLRSTFYDTVKFRAASKKPLIVTTRMELQNSTPSIMSLFGSSIADTIEKNCEQLFVSP